MEPLQAWAIVIIWMVLPIVFILISKKAGSWVAPKESRCPFGPKMGWLVIIIFLGVIGLLIFFRTKHSQRKTFPK